MLLVILKAKDFLELLQKRIAKNKLKIFSEFKK